jgi:acetyl/propionyl-CoA carboxylase alpha subunit
MLAKLICWGPSREDALARCRWALDHFVILGVTTNIAFLRRVLDSPDFRAGRTHTEFLTDHPELAHNATATEIEDEVFIAAALATMLGGDSSLPADGHGTAARRVGPWSAGAAWRSA